MMQKMEGFFLVKIAKYILYIKDNKIRDCYI